MKIQGNLDLEGSQLKNFRIDNISSLPTVGSTDRGRTVLKTSESPKWWDGTKWIKFNAQDSLPIENAYIHYSFTENTNGRYNTIANAISAGYSELYIFGNTGDDYSYTLPLNISYVNIYGIGNVILFVQNLAGGSFDTCNITGRGISINALELSPFSYFSKYPVVSLVNCTIDVNDLYLINFSLNGTSIKSNRVERNVFDIIKGEVTSTKNWSDNYINISSGCKAILDITGLSVTNSFIDEHSRIQNNGTLVINKITNDIECVLRPYSLLNESCYEFINNDGKLIIYECNLHVAFQDTDARYFITNNSAVCSTYMTNTIIKFGTAFSSALINNGATVKFAVGSVITNKGFNGYGPTTGSVYNSNNYFN